MNRYSSSSESSNDDSAFLHLLSSQRELLSRLSRENAHFDAQPLAFSNGGIPASLGHRQHVKAFGISPNRSISLTNCRTDDDVVYSKGLSLGLGDVEVFTSPAFAASKGTAFDSSCDLSMCVDTQSLKHKLDRGHLELDEVTSYNKKRRLSSALFGSVSFFLDHAEKRFFQDTVQRRLSTSALSLSSFCTTEEQDDFLQLESFPTTSYDQPLVQHSPPLPSEVMTEHHQFLHLPDPNEAQEKMIALSKAMDKSQQSQQDIHDWDKKMGLKRSHSKTMRLSTRSRKKLRAYMKKHITALSARKR